MTADRRPAAVVAAASVRGDGPSLGPGLSGGAVPGRFPDVVPDLPLGPPSPQPAAVPREKWVEIVHKMVAVYGAPMTPEEESHVVDYLLAARPPGP